MSLCFRTNADVLITITYFIHVLQASLIKEHYFIIVVYYISFKRVNILFESRSQFKRGVCPKNGLKQIVKRIIRFSINVKVRHICKHYK